MQVVRNINNNVALCLDSQGNELVAFGRGIGFRKPPYEVELSRIERTFYGVDPKLISAIGDIPSDLVLIADEVVQGFVAATGKTLNPRVAFTLADHLAFAVQRQHKHLVFEIPVEQDVRDLYPDEVAAGHEALALVRERMHEWLPAEEEALVALHLVNAEEGSVQDGAPISREVISHIAAIVGQDMGAEIDRTGFDFTRFSSHMQHLIRRSAEGAFLDTKNQQLYQVLVDSYPETYCCVEHICAYLRCVRGRRLPDEERMYLILHVNRLCARGEMPNSPASK